jgi:hypothetical protein
MQSTAAQNTRVSQLTKQGQVAIRFRKLIHEMSEYPAGPFHLLPRTISPGMLLV